MPKVQLTIPEDRLDEFQAWFDEHNPPPAKAEVISFAEVPGTAAVAYRVVVSVRAPSAASAVEATWGKASP